MTDDQKRELAERLRGVLRLVESDPGALEHLRPLLERIVSLDPPTKPAPRYCDIGVRHSLGDVLEAEADCRRMSPRPIVKCPGCHQVLYDDAAKAGYCADHPPPTPEPRRPDRDTPIGAKVKWRPDWSVAAKPYMHGHFAGLVASTGERVRRAYSVLHLCDGIPTLTQTADVLLVDEPQETASETDVDALAVAHADGRAEGHADIAAKLREILDPEDKHHWNLDGLLDRVRLLRQIGQEAIGQASETPAKPWHYPVATVIDHGELTWYRWIGLRGWKLKKSSDLRFLRGKPDAHYAQPDPANPTVPPPDDWRPV